MAATTSSLRSTLIIQIMDNNWEETLQGQENSAQPDAVKQSSAGMKAAGSLFQAVVGTQGHLGTVHPGPLQAPAFRHRGRSSTVPSGHPHEGSSAVWWGPSIYAGGTKVSEAV
ncbi:hypothetical protein CB1_001310001 [Camelus ferus]|nr:hypothetical protein CB1_001713001 [Camelus ferus]EPY77146.1 hypothetical protein CB1_001310001 [Camelus ferus]